MAWSSISVAQQAQKNLLKTFDLNGQREVVANLDGEVLIERWNNSSMRVQMEISYENASVNIMTYLISKGRYNLTTTPSAQGLLVTSPNAEKPAQISKDGTLLKEKIVYTIFVPHNVTVLTGEEGEAKLMDEGKSTVAQ